MFPGGPHRLPALKHHPDLSPEALALCLYLRDAASLSGCERVNEPQIVLSASFLLRVRNINPASFTTLLGSVLTGRARCLPALKPRWSRALGPCLPATLSSCVPRPQPLPLFSAGPLLACLPGVTPQAALPPASALSLVLGSGSFPPPGTPPLFL